MFFPIIKATSLHRIINKYSNEFCVVFHSTSKRTGTTIACARICFAFFLNEFFLYTNKMNGLNLFNKILLKPDAVWKLEMFRFFFWNALYHIKHPSNSNWLLLETLFGEQIKIMFEFFTQIFLFKLFFIFPFKKSIYFPAQWSIKIMLWNRKRKKRKYKIYLPKKIWKKPNRIYYKKMKIWQKKWYIISIHSFIF